MIQNSVKSRVFFLAYSFAAYRSKRRDPGGIQHPDGHDDGVVEDLDQFEVTQACSQTAGTADNPESPVHQLSIDSQSYEAAPDSSRRATRPDDNVSLERAHSNNTLDTSQRKDVHQRLRAAVQRGEHLEDAKDLDRHFPLEANKISALNQSRDLGSLRQDLLRRYNLVKKAEDKIGLRWPLALFGLHLSIGVVSSVFFNSYDSRLQIAGTILNVVSIVLGNIKSVRRLFRLFEETKKRRTKM